MALAGWSDERQLLINDDLREKSRVFKEQFGKRRLRPQITAGFFAVR